MRPPATATALALACLLALLCGAARTHAQVAVAWNAEQTTVGRAYVLRTQSPWSPRRFVLDVGPDAVLATATGGRFLSLSRRDGVVTLFTARGRTQRRFELGAGSELEDIISLGRCSALITRRNAARLLHLDLCSGATRESTDLSGFADPDGNPDLSALTLDRGRLFVQVRRYNEKFPNRFAAPAYLAVVDAATEQLIDVDSQEPGVQAIELAGTSPKHRMQVVEVDRLLYVSASGGSMDAGGIEVIDLSTLRSHGLIIREEDGMVGADLGPFVMVTPELGYLIFSTDLTLSSHLHRFTSDGEVELDGLNVSVNYAVPALAHDPVAGTLFVPDGAFDRLGLHVFDAATGERLTTDPIPTDGPPTDVLLLRRFKRPRP